MTRNQQNLKFTLLLQMTYSELGLTRGWKKRGIMWKTGKYVIVSSSDGQFKININDCFLPVLSS